MREGRAGEGEGEGEEQRKVWETRVKAGERTPNSMFELL